MIGSKDLLMTDYQVKPPTMMFGAIKTANLIRVKLNATQRNATQRNATQRYRETARNNEETKPKEGHHVTARVS